MDAIDRQPHLTTPSLQLRPLQLGDWAALYAVASDPLIWSLHPAHDRWQEPVFREYFEQAMASGGALAIIDQTHGGIIGSSRYGVDRALAGEMEIGWTFLARSYWGGAMNAELKRAMLMHAFRYVERAIFIVGEHNLRSRRAMEKIGAHLTDRVLANATRSPGRHVVYAINREAFADGPLMRPGA